MLIELNAVPAGKLLLFVSEGAGTPPGKTRSSPATGRTSQFPGVVQFVSAPRPLHVRVVPRMGKAPSSRTVTTIPVSLRIPIVLSLLQNGREFSEQCSERVELEQAPPG